ncbi:MAG: sulfurtransferase TusA family protein [Cyanobacteriota bacterium]|nr:sulfurtransferase TusA family protein [Cyanobacteriota bacterium]
MTTVTPAACLDLRGTPCPLNYVRARLALEGLAAGDWLQVDLDAGEPEEMVSQSLGGEGHHVRRADPCPADPTSVRLFIRRGG